MSTPMSALANSSIKYAEFVEIVTPDETVTLTNLPTSVTISGITYGGMGSYLGISEIQQDIKATSTDLKVMITGIDPANVGLILSANIKGSTVQVWRGFLDSNNQIITSPSLQFFKRYQGVINNIAIDETFDNNTRSRVATCVMACASFRYVLDNRIAGIKTNPSNWQFLYPNDTSMNRVPVIASTYFDFGQSPSSGSQSASKVLGSTATNPASLVKFSNQS
jgi:hypothetical protein